MLQLVKINKSTSHHIGGFFYHQKRLDVLQKGNLSVIGAKMMKYCSNYDIISIYITADPNISERIVLHLSLLITS